MIHYETIDIGTEMHRYLEKWIESNPNPEFQVEYICRDTNERRTMSIGQITDNVIAAAHKYAADPKFRERTLSNDRLVAEAMAAGFADEVESLNESFQKAIRERNQHQTDLFHVRRESIHEIDRLEDELAKARKKIRKLKKQAKKA